MNLYCFDFFGAHVGHVDENGELFDSRGVKWGQLCDGHHVYDLEGRYRGRIGLQGSFLGEDGSCRWYVRDWDGQAPPGLQRRADGVPSVNRVGPAVHGLVALRIRRTAC